MRVGKVAVVHADLPCYFVHLFQIQSHQLLRICLDLAVHFTVDLSQRRKAAVFANLQQNPSELGYKMRGVVSAGQHHAEVQIIQSIFSSDSQLCSRSCHFAGSPRSLDPDFRGINSKRANRFQNGYKVHHLGQAGHFPLLVAAMRPNGFALLHVVNDPALGCYFRWELAQCCKFLGLVGVTSTRILGIYLFPAWIQRIL